MQKPKGWKANLLDVIEKLVSGLIPPVPIPVRVRVNKNRKDRK